MAESLGMDVDCVDRALDRLLDAGLVDLRPWRTGGRDGVWQILPVQRSVTTRSAACMSVAEILRSLGVIQQPPADAPGGK
jgi:hypothetical protein